MRLRFNLLSTVATIAVASTFSLLASADPPYPQAVHIGYQKGNSLVVLKNRGTLEQALASHGVKVVWQEFAYGPPLVEAINSGDIDLGFVGATPPVFAQAGAGPDVTYVGYSAPYQDNYAILVPKDSTAHSLADLKGKRIAVAKGSAGQYLLIAALEQAKLQLPLQAGPGALATRGADLAPAGQTLRRQPLAPGAGRHRQPDRRRPGAMVQRAGL
jgi:sulfonate transport system substrate-binding protein